MVHLITKLNSKTKCYTVRTSVFELQRQHRKLSPCFASSLKHYRGLGITPEHKPGSILQIPLNIVSKPTINTMFLADKFLVLRHRQKCKKSMWDPPVLSQAPAMERSALLECLIIFVPMRQGPVANLVATQ